MQKISADLFFHRKIFPIIWYGFIIFGAFDAARQNLVFGLIFCFAFAVIGYFLDKYFIGYLMDEVIDHGDYLLVTYKKSEDKIYFDNIKKVSFNAGASPQKVSLSLIKGSVFGNEIVFSPLRPNFAWFDYNKNGIVESLIVRANKARRIK